MAHTHENDCIVCGAHFDSLKELDKHNHEQHLRKSHGAERPRQEEPLSEDERTNRQQF
jgi:hypothetical protein